MILSKLLQFIVLLASLILSISIETAGENVYTVTPTTILSPNLQYINTSQLRQKNQAASPSAYLSSEAFRDQVVASSGTNSSPATSYEKKAAIVREDRLIGADGQRKETLRQLFDRRLIKR